MKRNSDKQNVRIRTPDQRLRVFVSSTLKEMADERNAARKAIHRLRLAAVMFELGARPHTARDLYRAYLEQSHVFIGIYGEQYGWIAPGESLSGLEEEYRLAERKPRLIYIKKPVSNREPRLAQMLAHIRDRDMISYKYFSSAEELTELIEADLALLLAERFELSEPGDGYSSNDDARTSHSTRQHEGARLLPHPPTPIIGRAQELEEACSMLENGRTRLLTLTGSGGSGKTRLAIETAREQSVLFESLYFVELASINDHALVPDAVAQVLGIQEIGAVPAEERVIGHLRDRKSLLVLDNFEQVLAAAGFVAELLKRCPKVTLLITSRVALRIRGESELSVHPLSIPEPYAGSTPEDLKEQGAVAMFCERARSVKPGFTLNPDNVDTVIEICRRLDGLPLAIELAVPRLRLLIPQALLGRLDHRLPLLSRGPRDLPDRQRTMKDTIAWSYDLLTEREASLFRQLSVFVGGCTVPVAYEICGPEALSGHDLLESVEELAAKNMIYLREGRDGEPRISMFETIREYAGEKLSESGEEKKILTRHAEFFTTLSETAEPFLTSGERDPWISRLEAELENIRAVLKRSLHRIIDPLFGIRTAGTLGWFWHLRGHLSEGRHWASAFSKMPEASDRTRDRAKVLFPAGGLAWSQGDYETCDVLLSESASIFLETGDLQGLLSARAILAGGLASLGNNERALSLCEDTTAIMREKGDRWGLAFILLWHGDTIIGHTHDIVLARSLFEESLSISEMIHDPWIRAEALNHLGVAAGMQGDFENAVAFFEESLGYHEDTGDRWAVARGLSGYADVLLRQSDVERAKELLKKSMRIWMEMGNRLGLMACMAYLAQVASAEGRAVRAARLSGAAPEPVRTVGYLFFPGDADEYQAHLEPSRETLGEAEWEKERRLGKAMTLEQSFRYAVDDPDGQ